MRLIPGNYKSKPGAGFTLIELLVVVAILAVLAGIVLVNVGTYINRGKNSSIEGDMATIATSGTIYFTTHGDYDNFCTDNLVTAPSAAIDKALGTTQQNCSPNNHSGSGCDFTTAAWCTCTPLKTTSTTPAGSTLCVDSTGAKSIRQDNCLYRCEQGFGNGLCDSDLYC